MSASTNLSRSANQAKLVGNPTPPNMAKISENTLIAASPAGFNLLNMRTDKTASDAAAAACRNYKDIDGLRRLQGDQIGKTHYDPGCGWRYRPSKGLVPEINQAALGTAEGPSFGRPGSQDEVSGGTKWYWNLGDAERDITTKICQSASKCKQLNLLGRYNEICGYCKSTGATVPVKRNGQTFSARYSDADLGCPIADIVTASTGSCEGFLGSGYYRTASKETFGTAGGRPSIPNGRGDLTEAFQLRRPMKEGYVDLDALNNCTEPPLSRDCVVLAARTAGCSDDGSLIKALKAAGGGDYDSRLKTSPVYASYKSVAAPGITSATLKDGSVALNVALDDFGSLMKHTQSQNKKLSLSARDLCIRSGEFEAYDSCSELLPSSIINSNNLVCVQQYWKNQGGTAQGKGYPNQTWFGKPYQLVIDRVRELKNKIGTEGFVVQDKRTNAAALLDFIGTESMGNEPSLPRSENTRGAETVWFDYGVDFYAAHPPVILRCDLRLAKDKSILNGEIVPFFVNPNDFQARYNFPSPDTKSFKSVFEVRSDTDQQMNFGITTDDGTMLSVNQNPFEGTANRGNDWGSWAHQGPTAYYSGKYPVKSEKSGATNTVVIQWFNGHGMSASHSYIQVHPTNPNWVRLSEAELYLTQEPLAPWLQYEVCTRPNNGKGNADGFFEKRFNGPCAKNYAETPFVSFDVEAKSITIQTDKQLRAGVPKGLPYISLMSSSSWKTLATIHVNAVRTYTILFRPAATLSSGSSGTIFSNGNGSNKIRQTFFEACSLYNNGSSYVVLYSASAFGNTIGSFGGPVTMNEWNLLVIQHIGDDNGLRKTTCNVESLARLRTPDGLKTFSQTLRSAQNISGAIVAGKYGSNYYESSGQLRLGGGNIQAGDIQKSFTGDVAWIHGFRNFLDTEELLKSEVNQTWISRWPRGNLDSEPQPKMTGFQIPEQNVYANNGSVPCDMYCRGYDGGSWNGELPREWNGAKCIRTPNNPAAGCFVNGQTVCTCQRTGTGWSSFRF